MKVALVFRKKNPAFFSIERVFSRLEKELEKKVTIDQWIAPDTGVSFRNVRAVRSFSRRGKADVYHITGDIHYAVFGLPRRRILLTIHDCVFLHQTSGLKRLILKKLLLDWPVRRSALITTISEASRQDILTNTGCSADKVLVIPNPVSGEIFYQSYEFNERQPVILFIGVTPNKNLYRVVPALKGIPCLLHIVGAITDEIRQLLKQHGIQYRQSIGLNDAEIAACYANADMILFPSTFEGFGLPILEAQAAGRPVVTSNIDPMREVAGDGACLVDPFNIIAIQDGVLKVIRDKAYREQLVEAGFRNIQRFDATTIAGQYLACYQQLNTLNS